MTIDPISKMERLKNILNLYVNELSTDMTLNLIYVQKISLYKNYF